MTLIKVLKVKEFIGMCSLVNIVEKINELCGDWDFRGISMDIPHLQSIEIIDEKINIIFEKWSSQLDDYVSCDAGVFENAELLERIMILNLEDKQDVLSVVQKIEDQVDFESIEEQLLTIEEYLKRKESEKDGLSL